MNREKNKWRLRDKRTEKKRKERETGRVMREIERERRERVISNKG